MKVIPYAGIAAALPQLHPLPDAAFPDRVAGVLADGLPRRFDLRIRAGIRRVILREDLHGDVPVRILNGIEPEFQLCPRFGMPEPQDQRIQRGYRTFLRSQRQKPVALRHPALREQPPGFLPEQLVMYAAHCTGVCACEPALPIVQAVELIGKRLRIAVKRIGGEL